METKTIKLNSGRDIHTCFAGDPASPPLLLIHGWPASHLLWRNIIPQLSEQFYVIAPDLPGHGQSDKHLDRAFDLSFLRQFILDFMDSLSLETVNLTAHDLGGMGALSLAARHPDRIDKFIIMNTAPYAEASFRLRMSLFLLRQPILARFLLHPFVFKQVLKTGIHNNHLLTPELVDCFRSPWFLDGRSIKAFSKTIQMPLKDMAEPVANLKRIKAPTLILWGKKDIFFPFSIARRLHQDIVNSQLVGVENAAHFCQEEEPAFIARTITAFLNDQPL